MRQSNVAESKVIKRRKAKKRGRGFIQDNHNSYEGTDKEYSWLPTNELTHTPDLTSDFHSAYPNKPGPM